MRLICFISVCSLFASPLAFAGAAGASAAASNRAVLPALSVVKVGPGGRLIRVREALYKPTSAHAAAAAAPAPAAIPELVEQASRRYHVDPLLVSSVIGAESNFDTFAVSSKGAMGLMQLIPSTAERFGVANPFDPRENIDAGVRYLRYLQDLFPNDLKLTLAAYNAGEGAVARYKSVPPYKETVDYVAKVQRHYVKALLASAPPPAAVAQVDGAEPLRHVQQFIDAEGRLHLVTR